MAEQLKQCEFFLLRYVPDAVKGEFVNIGVVLLGPNGIELRFSEDWSRVRCLDPDVDLDMLQAVESELRMELSRGETRMRMLEKLRDSFSTSIRLSPVTGCLTESLQAEADLLAHQYLETSAAHRVKAERGAGARLKLAAQMRRSFEDVGVWEQMMKKIPASEYTAAGDPLKIDCGYRHNGNVRLFHAVSLQSSAEGAKLLAYSYPQIQDGMFQKLNVQTELTALIEENLNRASAEVSFGIHALERSKVVIATPSDLPKIAERARLELRV